MTSSKQLHTHNKLNFIAILYAVLTIWLGEYIFSILIDANYVFMDELVPRIIKTILIYLPFGLLLLTTRNALKKSNANNVSRGLISSCVTGWVITTLLWGYYFYEGYTYQIYNKTGGADIGLGIILMFSPIIIIIVMYAVYFISSKYLFKNNAE